MISICVGEPNKTIAGICVLFVSHGVWLCLGWDMKGLPPVVISPGWAVSEERVQSHRPRLDESNPNKVASQVCELKHLRHWNTSLDSCFSYNESLTPRQPSMKASMNAVAVRRAQQAASIWSLTFR